MPPKQKVQNKDKLETIQLVCISDCLHMKIFFKTVFSEHTPEHTSILLIGRN